MKNINKLVITLSLFATISLISSCNEVKSPTAKGATLANTSWTLVKMKGNNQQRKGKRAITLNFSDTRASGFSGCNQYFSNYTLSNGNDIKFTLIGSTKRGCFPRNITKREHRYLNTLGATRSFRNRGDHLILKGGQGKLKFILGKKF